jgi:hypothetical protein
LRLPSSSGERVRTTHLRSALFVGCTLSNSFGQLGAARTRLEHNENVNASALFASMAYEPLSRDTVTIIMGEGRLCGDIVRPCRGSPKKGGQPPSRSATGCRSFYPLRKLPRKQENPASDARKPQGLGKVKELGLK